MNKIIRNICIASMSVTMVNAAIVQTWNFNTATDTEGWIGDGDAGTLIQATSINTVDGVLTSQDGVADQPQLFYTNNIALGAGQTWEKAVVRVRQLDASGTASQTWDVRGTVMVLNLGALNGGLIRTPGYTITEQADNWRLVELDISALGAVDITTIRFDPIGHTENIGHNFELDSVELSAIPEPATLGLIGVFGAAMLFIRRRFMTQLH